MTAAEITNDGAHATTSVIDRVASSTRLPGRNLTSRRVGRFFASLCRVLISIVRLVAITAAHGLLYGVRRGMMACDAEAGQVGRLQGASMAALLERLGPTYIKLGQMLSTRPDLIGSAVAAGLARLQERVHAIADGRG